MGVLKDIVEGLKSFVNNKDLIESGDNIEDAVILAMHDTNVSSEDAALLVNTSRNMDMKADQMDKHQTHSVGFSASDIAITMGKLGLFRGIRERRAEKLAEELRNGEGLPKDETVKYAESTNGKIQVNADNIENIPREKGGQIREKIK